MTEIFVADPDAQFTCPYDGARTEAISSNGWLYIEKCPQCNRTITFEFEDEDYDD